MGMGMDMGMGMSMDMDMGFFLWGFVQISDNGHGLLRGLWLQCDF